jgi:hypothetical protein
VAGTLIIYKNTLEGRVPIARLVQDERGHTEFVPGHDPAAFERMVAMFGGRFRSRHSNQDVTPEDGEEFFKAVFAELANSTYVSASLESSAEGPAPRAAPQGVAPPQPPAAAPALAEPAPAWPEPATAWPEPAPAPPQSAPAWPQPAPPQPQPAPAGPPAAQPTGLRGWLARRRRAGSS